MNFNGTAGLWRRAAIVDAGGWSADTLTEDLDLSYRAQLRGWRTHFLADLEVPAELPGTLAAFKAQQFRWSKGSIQVAGKLLPRVYRSGLSPWAKLQATLHLTHYAVHPLMLVVALLAWPVMAHFSREGSREWAVLTIAIIFFAMIAPNSLYVVSQRALYRDWRRRLLWLPALTVLGIGVAVSNSRAVVEALLGLATISSEPPSVGSGRTRPIWRPARSNPGSSWGWGSTAPRASPSACPPAATRPDRSLLLYAASFLAVGSLGLGVAPGLRRCRDRRQLGQQLPHGRDKGERPPAASAGPQWRDAVPPPSLRLRARRSAVTYSASWRALAARSSRPRAWYTLPASSRIEA